MTKITKTKTTANIKASIKAKTDLATQHQGSQSDLLAREYLQILSDLSKSRPKASPSEPAVSDEHDGELDNGKQHGQLVIRPDVALTAVLLARAVERQPGLDQRLKSGAVIVVRLDSDAQSGCVRTILSKCAIGKKAAEHISYIGNQASSFYLIAGEKSDRNLVRTSDLSLALSQGVTIIGLVDPKNKTLPQLLLDCAECELVLDRPDPAAITLALSYATKWTFIPDLAPETAELVTPTDLVASVRPNWSHEDAFNHIRKMVSQRAKDGTRPRVPVRVEPGLEDLHGYGAAKTWGLGAAEDLRDYANGKISWDDCSHRGLLLSGPPGVGKTLFAQAFAKTTGLKLISTSVADWNAGDHLSGTLRAIKNVFAAARAAQPSILFIDELDGISSRARVRNEYAEYWAQIVNLLLEELQGASGSNEGVIVLGATNFPDMIDPAVLRSGRIDQHIRIGLPDYADLVGIYRYCLGSTTFDEDALSRLASSSIGSSGADIDAYVHRAKSAARRNNEPLSERLILAQIGSIHLNLSAKQLRRIAIHESGHAVMHYVTGYGTFNHLALTKSGGQMGIEVPMYGHAGQSDIETAILIVLAGYAAEELVFGQPSLGYANGEDSDLKTATTLAVARQLAFEDHVAFTGSFSDALTAIPGMYKSVGDCTRKAIEDAKRMLGKELPLLQELADALQRAHHLDKSAFDRICAEHGHTHRHQVIQLKEAI